MAKMNYQRLAYEKRAETDNRLVKEGPHRSLTHKAIRSVGPDYVGREVREQARRAKMWAEKQARAEKQAKKKQELKDLAELLDLHCARCGSNDNEWLAHKLYGKRHWIICVQCPERVVSVRGKS